MAELCERLLLRLREDHHVVDVHQASLPAHAGQDKVQSALSSKRTRNLPAWKVAGTFRRPKGMRL